MIRFSCKQCGKHFERSDATAGTLVFCDCGVGNRVPWESTLTAEEAATVPGQPPDDSLPADREESEPPVRRRRDRLERRTAERNPEFCFNHQDRPSEATCADCGEALCLNCTLTLQGQTLCGPCKNFRIRTVQRPRQFSLFALFSILLGLFTAPLGLFCVSLSTAMHTALPSFAGLLLPLAAVVLGAKALRDIETKPRMSGRSIAIAGMVSGLVSVFLTAVWAVLVEKQID
jgi:hypothetical protein